MLIYNNDPNLFRERRVRLLRDYPSEGLNAGAIVTGFLAPNNHFYLKTSEGIFETDAVLGTHYEEE